MELGLQLYGPLQKNEMSEKELLKTMKEVGYSFLEPCICLDGESDNVSFWSIEHFERIYEEIKAEGFSVISCHVMTADYIKSLPLMCSLAEKYSIKHFVVGVGELTKEAIEERARVYMTMADSLKEYGARVLIHNGKPDTAVKIEGKTALEYMYESCRGKAGAQFDIGWCMAGGEDPVRLLNDNMKYMESIHFKDFMEPGISDVDCVIGDGKADNKVFKEFGLKNNIPLLVDQDAYDDVPVDAKKSYSYLEML